MQNAQNDLKERVDAIISKRRELLPSVEKAVKEVRQTVNGVKKLERMVDELQDAEENAESVAKLGSARQLLDDLSQHLDQRLNALSSVQSRFSRDVVTIGVSGEARVGKSTTLQKFAGLHDTQVPTGEHRPVTAVRSEIYNGPEPFAEVTFLDEPSFISEYVQVLLRVIEPYLTIPIRIESVAALTTAGLPENLGEGVPSKPADALLRLREAQRSVATYSPLLTGRTERVELEDLRRYVAYPPLDSVTSETTSAPADRAHLAVRSVRIFCPFPRIEGVPIGLVDLPGLGEIGGEVDNLHLRGLEEGIDQVFMIMRPTRASAYYKQSIGSMVDGLLEIQKGVRRADLITAGINIENGDEAAAESLADAFQRGYNDAQTSDKLEILRFDAVDDHSVELAFDKLLDKIADRLPAMDQQVLAHAQTHWAPKASINDVLGAVMATISDVRSRIPLPERQMQRQVDTIARRLVRDYDAFEVDQVEAAKDASSDWAKQFAQSVKQIHKEVATSLADGFFLGREGWEQTAFGHKDYYTFYRDEAQRLRREIIARYTNLDTLFYDDRLKDFKTTIIEILFDNTGDLRAAFLFRDTDDIESRIATLAAELGGTIRDPDLDSALALLSSVQFSFRNNVFLQISEHLDILANAPDELEKVVKSIRKEIGGRRPADEKIPLVADYLTRISRFANDAIEASLLKQDDQFYKYLSVSSSFFNDYLYRKDFDNFKNFVIRSLIDRYRAFVLADQPTVVLDHAKEAMFDQIAEALRTIQGGSDGSAASAIQSGTSSSRSSNDVGTDHDVSTSPRISSSVEVTDDDMSTAGPEPESTYIVNDQFAERLKFREKDE